MPSRYQERPGVSLAPNFTHDGAAHHQHLWWLHQGNRAFRRGDWKLVAEKGDPWELYDLSSDRTETNDVAAQRPDLVADLARTWEEQMDHFHDMATSDEAPTQTESK